MTAELEGFVYRWEPGAPGSPVLLLLHGTGGNEHDLVPLGAELRPGASLLSPRGRVLEGSMPRFFRRLAEGVFDLEDLARRTDELAAFVRAAGDRHGFAPADVVAVGFSNGANIAASLLLRHPGLVRRAVLFRAMLPFEPSPLPALAGTGVLLTSGQGDAMIPAPSVRRLAEVLVGSGAVLRHEWLPAGHGLVRRDLDLAREWLAEATGQVVPSSSS